MVRFVLFVGSESVEVKMEMLSKQNFLPRLHDKVLIYEDIKEYLSAWASAVEILFSAYDMIPTVNLRGASGKGSMAERVQKLEKLGWKKV
jgi:hypothetical protein